jgi:hypothetical protein
MQTSSGKFVNVPETRKDSKFLFRPERWENLPEKAHEMPGVYSNMLSFLAGPHHCVGFRFAIAE